MPVRLPHGSFCPVYSESIRYNRRFRIFFTSLRCVPFSIDAASDNTVLSSFSKRTVIFEKSSSRFFSFTPSSGKMVCVSLPDTKEITSVKDFCVSFSGASSLSFSAVFFTAIRSAPQVPAGVRSAACPICENSCPPSASHTIRTSSSG